jgi:hypothetical protein
MNRLPVLFIVGALLLSALPTAAADSGIGIQSISRADAFSISFGYQSSINPLKPSLSGTNACLTAGFSLLEYDQWWFFPIGSDGWGIGAGFGSRLVTMRTTDNKNVFGYSTPGFFDFPFYDCSPFPLLLHIPFYSCFDNKGHRFAWLEFKWDYMLATLGSMELAVHLEYSIISASVGWLYYYDTSTNNFYRPAYSGIFFEVTLPFESYSEVETSTNRLVDDHISLNKK